MRISLVQTTCKFHILILVFQKMRWNCCGNRSINSSTDHKSLYEQVLANTACPALVNKNDQCPLRYKGSGYLFCLITHSLSLWWLDQCHYLGGDYYQCIAQNSASLMCDHLSNTCNTMSLKMSRSKLNIGNTGTHHTCQYCIPYLIMRNAAYFWWHN